METKELYQKIQDMLDTSNKLDNHILKLIETFEGDYLVLHKVESMLFTHLGTHTFTKCRVCIFMLLSLFTVELGTGETQVEFNLKNMSKEFGINVFLLKDYIKDGLGMEFIQLKINKNKVHVKMINPYN